MGLRFRKSIKIAPGVRLNLGKKSAGISIGGKSGGVSFNTRTGARARVSAPGTGLSYSTKIGGKKHRARKASGKSTVYTTTTAARRTVSQKPVVLRWWYGLIAIVCLSGGIGNIPENIGAAFLGIGIGVVMLAISFNKYRSLKVTEQSADVNLEDQVEVDPESETANGDGNSQ